MLAAVQRYLGSSEPERPPEDCTQRQRRYERANELDPVPDDAGHNRIRLAIGHRTRRMKRITKSASARTAAPSASVWNVRKTSGPISAPPQHEKSQEPTGEHELDRQEEPKLVRRFDDGVGRGRNRLLDKDGRARHVRRSGDWVYRPEALHAESSIVLDFSHGSRHLHVCIPCS